MERDAGRRGPEELVPIGWAIGGMLALAVGIAAAVIAVLFAVGRFQGFQKEPLTAAALYDLLKIGFAFAAGIGGVVALVTAYRRQRVSEFAHNLAARTEERATITAQQEHELAARAEERETTRLFNERFAAAAGQLGDERAAVRLAGVYAMAGLADDWAQQRQTCVNVLCAYLRMPYGPPPAADAPDTGRQAFRASQEVRHTVIRVIADHLQADDRRSDSMQDWRELDLDFTGAMFDGESFRGAEFSGGEVSFRDAKFSGATVSFYYAKFSGATVSFSDAKFSGAEFSGGTVDFRRAEFSGGTVDFNFAEFSGTVDFPSAEFSGATVSFYYARFSGGTVDFNHAKFSGGTVGFSRAEFSGGTVNFRDAEFFGGTVDFSRAEFSGGTVNFRDARFSGGTVDFRDAEFSGGTVDFRDVGDWWVAPAMPDWDQVPDGVRLPVSRASPPE